MTLIINVGKWGGIYVDGRLGWRLCLGWIAFTILFVDLDDIWFPPEIGT